MSQHLCVLLWFSTPQFPSSWKASAPATAARTKHPAWKGCQDGSGAGGNRRPTGSRRCENAGPNAISGMRSQKTESFPLGTYCRKPTILTRRLQRYRLRQSAHCRARSVTRVFRVRPFANGLREDAQCRPRRMPSLCADREGRTVGRPPSSAWTRQGHAAHCGSISSLVLSAADPVPGGR